MDAAGKSRVLTVPDDWLAEPARVRSVENDELPQFYDAVTGQPSNHPPTTAPAPVRRKCGIRARASRGRAVRVRGSRRSGAASQSASSGDPDLGDEPPRYRPWFRQVVAG